MSPFLPRGARSRAPGRSLLSRWLVPGVIAASGPWLEGAAARASDESPAPEAPSDDLQKDSGTAAAFSEAQLSNIGITNVRDLSSQVPGLQIGNQEGNTEVYIRSIGSGNNTELGDPAFALHLDGVYLPRPGGSARCSSTSFALRAARFSEVHDPWWETRAPCMI